MDINKIKSIGGFDDISLGCSYIPMYKHGGLVVISDNIQDSLNVDLEFERQAFGQLILHLYGIKDEEADQTEQLGRTSMQSKQYRKENNTIAKANILILKSRFDTGDMSPRAEESLASICESVESIGNYLAAHRLAQCIASKLDDIHPDELAIGIVDKIYVEEQFRRRGVSSWIHSNIANICSTYTGYYLSGLILTCGDFKDEAERVFGVTKEEYIEMLHNQYSNLGYTDIARVPLMKDIADIENIMFKVV